MAEGGEVKAPAEGGFLKRHGKQTLAWLFRGGHGPILLMAGAAFLLDFVAPRPLTSRFLSSLLTSALFLIFAVFDIRRLIGAESKARYLTRRWLDLGVLALLFLFSSEKVLILAQIAGNPEEAAALAPTYDLYATVVLIAIFVKLLTGEEQVITFLERLHLKPAQTVALSFATAAILGALLLSLPQAVTDLAQVSFLDSLFTATSAVCVTGLVVNDIGRHYTLFGQGVILMLIQLGGLGIMTFSALLTLLSRTRMELGEELTFKEALSAESLGTIRQQVKQIFLLTFAIEAVGALFLLFRWLGDFPGWRAFYVAAFHAVSAFSNAGFSLFSENLMGYVGDPVVNFTIATLIILGGLGFPVLSNLMAHPLFGKKGQPWRLSFHAKMALTVSGALILIGLLLILLLEFHRGLGHLPFPQKFLAAFFQSVTTRTAGFSTLNIGTLAPATLYGIMILMFIGGSPGSTAGGIKTTTFGTMAATLLAILRGRDQVEAFRRAIPPGIIHKALALTFIVFAFLNLSILLLLLTEKGGVLELLFEATSAFGTVGLSTGYTPRLSPSGKGIIIVTMLVGRIGPLSLAFAIAEQPAKGKYAYPTERLLVG